MPIPRLRRTAVLAAAAALFAATPALAAPGNDGTSNTIEYAVTAIKLDPAHHRALVSSPDLKPGTRMPRAILVTPQNGYTFENVFVESLTGASESPSLNFTQVNVYDAAPHCPSGASACLIEEDGLYPPFG